MLRFPKFSSRLETSSASGRGLFSPFAAWFPGGATIFPPYLSCLQPLSEPDKQLSHIRLLGQSFRVPPPKAHSCNDAFTLFLSVPFSYPIRVCSHSFSPLHDFLCFSFLGRLPVGTFAQRGLVASSLSLCSSPVPITRDAAVPRPLFTLSVVLGYFRCGPFPQELLARRSPG